MLPELASAHVRMKNPDRVSAVIRSMIANGSQRLQVISDFDMTLSRFKDSEGRLCDTSYGALEKTTVLPSDFKTRVINLKKKYYPVEVDPKLTIEEKCPHMVEWWSQTHNLMLTIVFKQSYLTQIVSESSIHFRDGSDWLFDELHKHNVPLLIFSAGVGDVVVEAVKQRAMLHDNVKVVSNFMDFDSQGLLKGFHGTLIHVFNKNENALHKSDYFEKLVHRDSIILMGDSLGDLRMAHGAAECHNILTFGFLNDKVEERLPAYMEAFDVVLINDQSMTVPNAVLRQILYTAENSVATTNCDVLITSQCDTNALPLSSSASEK